MISVSTSDVSRLKARNLGVDARYDGVLWPDGGRWTGGYKVRGIVMKNGTRIELSFLGFDRISRGLGARCRGQ